MRNINRKFLVGGGIIAFAIVGFLAIGVFGLHTLFIDETVDEANPFSIDAEPSEPSDPVEAAGGEAEPSPDEDTPSSGESADGSGETATDTPTVLTLTAGAFVDGEHPTSGDALVITADGSDQRFLRFENFQSDNGPDLNVYLRSSANPDNYIDLGDLKGNIGDQNYELPSDIDPAVYDLVDIWCVRFGVSFGSATLSA